MAGRVIILEETHAFYLDATRQKKATDSILNLPFTHMDI